MITQELYDNAGNVVAALDEEGPETGTIPLRVEFVRQICEAILDAGVDSDA